MEEQYSREYLQELAYKWKIGTITNDEQDYLDKWDASYSDDVLNLPDDCGGPDIVKARMFKQVNAALQKNQIVKVKKLVNIKWLSVAALLLITGTLLFYNSSFRQLLPPSLIYIYVKNDIAPGKNTALITLSSGKTITLSDTKSGIVIDAGKLNYNDGTPIKNQVTEGMEREELLTASTPRGGQYQITLPDGSRVWLNAASSITFPVKFNHNERKVKLTGEGYFEVAKVWAEQGDGKSEKNGRNNIPFVVETAQQQVKVLGTHFNISSYADEGSTRTTLIEGSVQVSAGNNTDGHKRNPQQSVILSPGEQAEWNKGTIQVNVVNTDNIVAWKNGKFSFKNEQLQNIMKKLARWYDIEVEFENEQLMKKTFSGKVSRYDKASEVLKILEMTGGARFKIDGRKITVL